MTTAGPRLDVRRSDGRDETRTDWLRSRHSFSFGPYYDPANTGFGALVAHNEDRVAAGSGYDTHPHRDLEIVTWVLEGALVHRDSAGRSHLVHPGLVQRISAGTGIRHSERNDPWTLTGGAQHRAPVRFVQMWVRPDEPGGEPAYDQRDVTADLDGGGLVVVASGIPRYADRAVLGLRSAGAALHAARLPAQGAVTVPAAPYLHLFMARGTAALEGAGALAPGDAVRVVGSEGQRVVAGPDGAEVLVWELHPRRPAWAG